MEAMLMVMEKLGSNVIPFESAKPDPANIKKEATKFPVRVRVKVLTLFFNVLGGVVMILSSVFRGYFPQYSEFCLDFTL